MRIELFWKWIHYDVDQLTWRYGKTHNSDEENKEISQTTANNESDANLMLRFAVTGTARLRRYLSDYISAKTEDANDALPLEKKKWGFNFNSEVEADGHALAELMHWFVVRWCMLQWCNIFAPDQSALERAELNELKKDLDGTLGGSDSAMPMKEKLTGPDDKYQDEVVFTYLPVPEDGEGEGDGGSTEPIEPTEPTEPTEDTSDNTDTP